MDINGLGAGTSAATNVMGDSTMGKEEFLKLLVAQLEHQDPLDPMNNTEFVSQLSQFSSLEQLMNMSEGMQMLQMSQTSAANGQMASLIGREVEAKGDIVRHTQVGPDAVTFNLDSAANSVMVRIRDAKGAIIREINAGARSGGINTIGWDGKDVAGNMVPIGDYKLDVSAVDGAGKDIAVSTTFNHVVTGINFKNGVPLIELGATTVQLADVLAVRENNGGGT